ncbi:hypothetical protein [Allosphingosinicella sp.]|uniref:hypothetical protein n=1 Tax=Allosphingosinicella sp. TaxID=2823234 RepID=UPI003784C062
MFTLHKPALLKLPEVYQRYDTPAIDSSCEFGGETVQAANLGHHHFTREGGDRYA